MPLYYVYGYKLSVVVAILNSFMRSWYNCYLCYTKLCTGSIEWYLASYATLMYTVSQEKEKICF